MHAESEVKTNYVFVSPIEHRHSLRAPSAGEVLHFVFFQSEQLITWPYRTPQSMRWGGSMQTSRFRVQGAAIFQSRQPKVTLK